VKGCGVDFLAGLQYPLRALSLLRQTPRLWGYVIVPILVNLVVGALLYLGVYWTLWQFLQHWLADSAPWAEALRMVLGALLAVLLAVGVGFVLVRFGVVLGAPWYSQLSEELEALLSGQVRAPTRLSLAGVSYDLWRALLFELKKLGLGFSLWLLTLLLLLVPVGGALLHATAGMLLGATIACLDFFDGPQERRRLSFRQKLATIRQTLPASLSFGLVAFSLVSIPLVNLLAIPLCVAAGNMFVIERALPTTESVRRPGSPASDRAA
jgi:CysZ protein